MPFRSFGSFEENEFVIAGVAGPLEFEVPFLRRMEDPAGELPIHQVHLLALVAIGLDTDVFRAAADTIDFFERRVKVVVVEVVQRVDGDDEVEMLVGIAQFCRGAELTVSIVWATP